VRATWQLLRRDRDLLWLPVVGGAAAALALVALLVPGLLIGWAAGDTTVGGWVGAALGVFAASCVGIYFQAALVLGAFQRADGHDPSFGSTLRQVWGMRRGVVQWALLTTTVGMAVRAIEQRLGVIGTVIGFLGGLAWAVASFFTVPILIAEGLGPVDATRRSANLIKQRWGANVRTTLRIGWLQALALLGCVAGFLTGLAAATAANTAVAGIGLLVMLAAAIGFAAVIMLGSAVLAYSRALLYRHAVGLPVPGIPSELYGGVFRARRRWGRR
jgi:hypothetical protein